MLEAAPLKGLLGPAGIDQRKMQAGAKTDSRYKSVCIVRSRPREGKEGHEVAEGALLTYRVYIMSPFTNPIFNH